MINLFRFDLFYLIKIPNAVVSDRTFIHACNLACGLQSFLILFILIGLPQ